MAKIKTSIGTYIEDITGQTFDRITVLELTDKKNNDNRWLWKCQCNCKDKPIIYRSMHFLKSSPIRSCGCRQREFVIAKNKANAYNIAGERKGTLTAIKRLKNKTSSNGAVWQIKCDCGNIFPLSIGEWNRDKYGDGHRARLTCPLCSTKSKGQLLLRNIFKENNVFIQEEWTDNNKCRNPKTNAPLRFDFYLPDYNCCIEYDGEQHFFSKGGYFSEEFVNEVKKRDSIKNEYCRNNNIKLIRIPYTNFMKVNYKYLKEKGAFDE